MKQELFLYIDKLKRENKLEITDTHIHPLDVMGVVHYSNYDSSKTVKEDEYKVGILEKLSFGRISNFLSNTAFKHLENVVKSELEALFDKAGEERLLDEMDKSLVDKASLLPVEPWLTSNAVFVNFSNERFNLLASINIHKVKEGEIKTIISKFKKEFGIVGLKLHPNLQDFKPQPSHNEEGVAKKLRIIYKTADELGLYLLFHGGVSSYTKYVNSGYEAYGRSKNNAVIHNFISPDGSSELFDYFKGKIIIAHLGHFGLSKINEKIIKKIIQKHNHVFFDTAASSPRMISEFIKIASPERVVLGSDGIYNRMSHSIDLVYRGVKRSGVKDVDKAMCQILGDNYKNKILGK